MPPPLEVKKFFRKQFGYTPTHVVQAPGRLELLGNHTDYNQGLVMSLAINRYVYVASSPRSDGRIELTSSAFPEQRDKFWLTEFKKNPDVPWTDYFKGVLEEMRKRGVHFSGFNAAVHSTLPIGAGMSSSGALEVAAALTVRQLYPHRLTESGTALPPRRDRRGGLPALTGKERMQVARLCAAAENNFVGVRCGMLDQISSLFGREYHALTIDFLHHTVETIPMAGEFGIVVCDSGVKHELAAGQYNELREQCEAAAKALKAKSLRSVEPRYLSANRRLLTERQYQCAYHIVGENQRVIFGERALREGDFAQFGQYLFQSHESSRDYFKNSCAELDLLVELAREHPACVGARLTGGGFGGATINLIRLLQVEDFIEHMKKHYPAKSGHPTAPVLCGIVDGAE